MVEDTVQIKGLQPVGDERVLYNQKPSLILFVGIIAAIGIIALFLSGQDQNTISAIFLGSIAYLFFIFDGWKYRYVITDKRVIKRKDFLSEKTIEISLDDISSLSTKSNFLEGILGRGTVIISTGGGSGFGGMLSDTGTVNLSAMKNYRSAAQTLREEMQQE